MAVVWNGEAIMKKYARKSLGAIFDLDQSSSFRELSIFDCLKGSVDFGRLVFLPDAFESLGFICIEGSIESV